MRRFDPKKDYYRLLGVSKNASQKQIDQAYRAEARMCHPDLGGSEEKMKSLNEAYEILKDRLTRKAYDDEREPPGRAPRRAVHSSSPAFNPEAAARSGTLKVPVASKDVVWLSISSVACFWGGVILLTYVEYLIFEERSSQAWLLRVAPLTLFGLGVLLAHAAFNIKRLRTIKPLYARLIYALRKGILWAAGFVAAILLIIFFYEF